MEKKNLKIQADFGKFFEKNVFLLTRFKKKRNIIRIPIPMNLFWSFDPLMAKKIILNPKKVFPEAEKSLKHFCKANNFITNHLKNQTFDFKIDIKGPFGKGYSSPKFLKAKFIGELICIRGIVVECLERKVINKQSIHFCPSTGKILVHNFLASKKFHYSILKDPKGNKLETELGLSTFEDWQKIVIQDQSRRLSPHEFPTNIVVILQNDLVNQCYLGDQVEICGILRPVPEARNFSQLKVFSIMISALSVRTFVPELIHKWTKIDSLLVRNFSTLSNSFERLSSLILPDLIGQNQAKKGILLSLISGNTNKVKKKKFLREEINLLLAGGFSGEKEKFLRFIRKFSSSLSISNNLFHQKCEDVTYFSEHPNRNQRPDHKGPFFFDKGTLCVEDLDKISEFEKILIEEIMDYQAFTLNHGKFQSFFDTNCNIIATINSLPDENNDLKFWRDRVDLSEKIIPRFDCVFILSVYPEREQDRYISDNLIRIHRKSTLSTRTLKKKNEQSFESSSKVKHKKKSMKDWNNLKFFSGRYSLNFLKVFLQFARFNIIPILSDEANETIVLSYLNWKVLRTNKFRVSIKNLETLARLSIAYSKCHLQEKVSVNDVKFVENFLKKCWNFSFQEKKKEQLLFTKEKNHKYEKQKKENSKIRIPKNVFTHLWYTREGQFFFDKHLKYYQDPQIKLYEIKKFLGSKDRNSFLERTLIKCQKKSMCIFFKKIVLKL